MSWGGSAFNLTAWDGTGVKQADVIIVGAGPSGCAAAYFLARARVRVILLDKETFPRDKSCGDGIGRASLAQLARMRTVLGAWKHPVSRRQNREKKL